MIEKHYDYTGYAYVYNNPIKLVDPFGLDSINPNRSAQGVFSWSSYTGVQSERVRNNYVERVSNLDANDSRGRTNAKINARQKTPTVTKTMAENMRPISGESNRVGGTANKSNASVNNRVKTYGNIGKVAGVAGLGISVYNISNADNKGKAVVEEGGAWTGAIIGGEAGAVLGGEVGLLFGGAGAVPGAVIGGFLGSITGAIIGGEAAEKLYDNVKVENKQVSKEEFMKRYDWDKYGQGTK